MLVMRLNQITAPATDLAASIAFYEMLGLRLIVRADHYARFELPKGEATFSLHITDGDVARANAPQLYFEVNDVDFEVRRLKHAGIAFEQEPKDQTWLWREAWLRDPAGNSLCIFNAGDARRFPPWRIDQPAGAKNMHIVIRDNAPIALRKHDGDWQALSALYPDYKTSLGPYDLFDVLAMLEAEWPTIFNDRAEDIRAFASSDNTELEL